MRADYPAHQIRTPTGSLALATSPFQGEDEQPHSRGALFVRARALPTTKQESDFQIRPRPTKEGGGAPKGASNQCRVGSGHGRGPHPYPPPLAGAGARLPALHRGTCKRRIASLSSGPRFLELPGANGRTLPGASAASTSQTGPSAGRDDARNRPGTACVAPPREPLPLRLSGAPSRKASLDDSMSGMLVSYQFLGRMSSMPSPTQ